MLELFASLLWSLQNLLMMHPNLGQPWKNETKAEQRTVFDNHRKSLIQYCERSGLRLHLSGQKLIKNAKNGPFWRVFENLKLAVKQFYQTGQF